MSDPTPQIRLPCDRVIVNFLATLVCVLLFGLIAVGLGSNFRPLEWFRSGTAGNRKVQLGAVGLQVEFGPPKPHTPGGPDGNLNTSGIDFLGLSWTHENWEWTNAAVRWRSTTLGLPW